MPALFGMRKVLMAKRPVIVVPPATTMKSVVLAQAGAGSIATGNRFLSLAQGSTSSATATSEGPVSIPWPIAGTFSNLHVKFTDPGGAEWVDLKLHVDGVDAALGCTVNGGSTLASDDVNTVHINAGQRVCIKKTASASPAAIGYVQVSALFTSDVAGESFIIWPNSNPDAATTKHFEANGVKTDTTEANVSVVMPTGGTIDRLYVRITVAPGAGASGKSLTQALVKNGTPTALSAQLLETALTANDLVTGAISFAAGDTLSLNSVPANTPTVTGIIMAAARWIPTIPGESLLFLNATTAPSDTVSRYGNVNGVGFGISTEVDAYNIVPYAFSMRKLKVKLTTAPGAGKSRSVTLRKGGASQSLTCTVADTNTESNDATNSVSLVADDLVNWNTTPTGTPASPVPMKVSAVAYIAP